MLNINLAQASSIARKMMHATPTTWSSGEWYLQEWHARHPHPSPFFIHARDRDGISSYQRLASLTMPGSTVLDLGCGSGMLLAHIEATTPSAKKFGVDISLTGLRLARERLAGVRLSLARAQALPLLNESVDAVVCHMALMLMDDPDQVLAEARRVLRAGGTFSAITNRPADGGAVWTQVRSALRPLWQRADSTLRPPQLGDVRTYEPDSLAAMVTAHFGNVIVESFEVTQHIPRRSLWRFLASSIYGLEAIPATEGKQALNGCTLPNPVPWTVSLLQVRAHA